jgi:hypothetical protein
MHTIYNKHVVSDADTPTGFYRQVCKECGMPVHRDYTGAVSQAPETISHMLNCSDPKFMGQDVMLACMAALTTVDPGWYVDKREDEEGRAAVNMDAELGEALHRCVGAWMVDHKEILDIDTIKRRLLKVSMPGMGLARFSANVLGCLDRDIEKLLLDRAGDVNGAGEALAALYIKYGVKPPKDVVDKVISTCDDYELRCFFSARQGVAKLNQIRANREGDAFATYHLLKTVKPEKLREAEWVNKRLSLTSYDDLALLHMFDNKDETTNISYHNALVITKFPKGFSPAIVSKAAEALGGGMDDTDKKWVFGDHTQRMEAARGGVSHLTLQVSECKDLEEYFSERLRETSTTPIDKANTMLAFESF